MSNKETFIINEKETLIIIGTITMLLLACGIIFLVVLYQRRVIKHQQEIKRINDQKQLELIQASIQGEEEERMRIACELHDDVGATLSSVRLFLHAAAQPGADEDILGQSKALLDESIGKVRGLSHRLQPAMLQQLGLQASLESFASMLSRTGNVSLQYICPEPLPRLDDNIELSVYRMVQELSSNIIRHANAAHIIMHTHIQPQLLLTTLLHNGRGMTNEDYNENIYKKGAIGLKNIVNRLKSINASISFDIQPDGQYLVSISVPTTITN